MASQLHTYTARVSWSGGREGTGAISNANSGQGFDLRVPPEFGGPGGALNPEELLTDAIAGCYSITYGIVAGNRRIPLRGIEVEAVGTVDQSGANFVYKSIALSPRITLGAEATDQDIATAVDMAHKADAYCIVTNAVRDKVQVSVTPSVQREGEAMQETKPVSGDQSLSSDDAATASATGAATGASTSAAASVGSGSGSGGGSQADTAPKEETSYTGSEAEEAYPEAGDAEKPDSATGPNKPGAENATTGTEQAGGSGGGSGSGSEAGLNTDAEAGGGSEGGVNPANSEADDVSASSQQTGDPEAMRVGAIPG